jgi:hypothetical protein
MARCALKLSNRTAAVTDGMIMRQSPPCPDVLLANVFHHPLSFRPLSVLPLYDTTHKLPM